MLKPLSCDTGFQRKYKFLASRITASFTFTQPSTGPHGIHVTSRLSDIFLDLFFTLLSSFSI